MHNEIFYTNKKIKKDIKLAVLSDIHYCYPDYKINIFSKLVKQIKKNQPDYICIVGDILDEANCTNIDDLVNFFKEISIIAPVIIVIGNRDQKIFNYQTKKWEFFQNKNLFQAFNKLNNVFFLDDNTYEDENNNISFYGINLPYEHYEIKKESYESFTTAINKLKCNLKKTSYNITLLHSPINIYNFIKKNPTHNLNKTDLILNGHMHNGCLPFIFTNPFNKIFKSSVSLISPFRTLFPQFAQGKVYGHKDGYIYQGVIKFSKIAKHFSKFDFIYAKKVQFITIKKSSS